MRAVCNTEIFSKKLALVSRGVSARSTIQLLRGILLETEEGSVRLSATDMEISIQTRTAAEVEDEGRVVIPARIFNDVARSLPGRELALAHDRSEGVVRLSARENEYRIRTYAAEDFPQLPKFDEAAAFKMSGEALVETVEKVSRSYSRDETRPVLTGILISFEESRVRMVTTDSYRLSIKETELVTTFDGSREELIETLRRVSFFTQRQTPPVPVSLAFSKGAVEVAVRNGEVGEARERLPATSEDEFHILFNPSYLLDGVSAVDSESVLFKLNESLKPGLIVPDSPADEGEEEPDFLYLIMPMRDPARG